MRLWCSPGSIAGVETPRIWGWTIALAGVAVIGRSLVAAVLVALFALAIHLHIVAVEERHLENVFGEEYRAYRMRVPRYLGRPGKRGPASRREGYKRP